MTALIHINPAETQQWEDKPGDILTLKWNRYTTGALAGQFPTIMIHIE